MKWKRFYKKGDDFVPGDWNVIDDRTGFKVKASETSLQWNGMRTARPVERNPQDFLRAIKERIGVPWARPEPDDKFVN